MRAAIILVLGTLLGSGAAAEPLPAFPPGAEAKEAALMAHIGPETRAWIRQEASRQAASATVSESGIVTAVKKMPALGALNGDDISAIAFIVMMEATKSADQDLLAIMQGYKAIKDARAAARQKIATANTATANPNNSGLARAVPPNRDDLNQLDETTSLRLQMAMDRRSRFMSTLSHMMKKMSETDQGLTKNLK